MRTKIRMQSTESAHFYTRHKNQRLHPEKMALNMYKETDIDISKYSYIYCILLHININK